MHDNDVQTMMNKQKEVDFIQKGLDERQKEDKAILGQIYHNQIEQKNKKLESDMKMEQELERMQVERIQAIDPDAYTKMKKKAYQKEFMEDLNQRNKLKQYEASVRLNSVREAKKLMDDYARNEMKNEQEYRDKFTKFDNGMQNRLKDYNNYVMKPTLDKKYKLDQIENKNVAEYNRKREEAELGRDAWRKAQIMNTSTEQRNQMNEQNNKRKLDGEFRKIEVKNSMERGNEINTFDQLLKEDKKKRQDMYREMLSSQIQYNKGLNAMGSMTQVEKKMNKMDLTSYKHYGKPPPKDPNAPKKVTTYEDQQRRLEAYGYGRYLKNAPKVGTIESYNAGVVGRSPAKDPINKSYTMGTQPYENAPKRDISNTPQSRRNRTSARGDPAQRSLMNAGAISMSQERGAAGSPSGVYQYRNQVL